MLVSLTIRNVVLIDQIALNFQSGLCVLTGETGAGKSILLDALGLALGGRADVALVRPGGTNQAMVVAEFAPPFDAQVGELLAEHGLEPPEPGENLVLRRQLTVDGRSRAFISDQAVGVQLLRRMGSALVVIEGQFASQGLLEAANHRTALDAFAGLETKLARLAGLHDGWRNAEAACADAEEALAAARAEEDYLHHVAEELAALNPQPGEETTLAETRSVMMNAEKLTESMNDALGALAGGNGVESGLGAARRALVRHGDKAAGCFDQAITALDRATDEAADALAALERAATQMESDPRRLEEVEVRLFALRAVARKHNTTVNALPGLCASIQGRIQRLENSESDREQLTKQRDATHAAYMSAAEVVSAARAKAARRLDKLVAAELAPLMLEKARFRTVLERLPEAGWSDHGLDLVWFEAATNEGMETGPMARIASGGELARFLLALKVVLQQANGVATLVFDEVDSGIGGATAAAVGERLARLSNDVQVMAVTHSPQVAAFGTQHLRVLKNDGKEGVVTAVDELSAPDRREEIARMLAGASVTDEARAAADSLMAGRTP